MKTPGARRYVNCTTGGQISLHQSYLSTLLFLSLFARLHCIRSSDVYMADSNVRGVHSPSVFVWFRPSATSKHVLVDLESETCTKGSYLNWTRLHCRILCSACGWGDPGDSAAFISFLCQLMFFYYWLQHFRLGWSEVMGKHSRGAKCKRASVLSGAYASGSGQRGGHAA